MCDSGNVVAASTIICLVKKIPVESEVTVKIFSLSVVSGVKNSFLRVNKIVETYK